jgi:predicted  nucleic acid-binding Zn-ribbon protein
MFEAVSGQPCPRTAKPRLRGAFFLLGPPKPAAKVTRMHPDLDRLIRLQQLETTAEEARRRIAEHPSRMQALDARLETVRDRVSGAKARLTAAQEKRRTDEKEVATVQARLAKYKDQLLE